MWAVVRCGVVAGAVGLLAAAAGAQERPAESSLPIQTAVKAEESQLQLEELKMAFRKLASDYAELQTELEEKDQALKALSQSLAAARYEAALLKQRLPDAAAAPAGADPMQAAKALAEAERAKRLLAAQQPAQPVEPAATPPAKAPEAVQPAPQPTLESGQVVSVNPGLQLVVINLGETQGVRLGMPFVVIHGDRIVGRVKVVEVRRKISGAVIEQMDRQAPIQVGDRVRVTKS
jgi:hypothetical protein